MPDIRPGRRIRKERSPWRVRQPLNEAGHVQSSERAGSRTERMEAKQRVYEVEVPSTACREGEKRRGAATVATDVVSAGIRENKDKDL